MDRVLDLIASAERGTVTCRPSAINVGEFAYIVERKSSLLGTQAFLAVLRATPIVVEDATTERILAADHDIRIEWLDR